MGIVLDRKFKLVFQGDGEPQKVTKVFTPIYVHANQQHLYEAAVILSHLQIRALESAQLIEVSSINSK